MSADEPGIPLPRCFQDYPGIVLQLAADGTILDSNGILEGALGRPVRGSALHGVMDAGSSGDKVERLLGLLSSRSSVSGVWELILSGEHTLPEPRCFVALRDPEGDRLWLLEQRTDPRMDELQRQVVEVNSDLTRIQRELVKERARLNRALQDLEAQYRRSAELANTVQEQNAALEERNTSLEALASELRRSNEALDEFAHVVSHDLKAPLRSIANHAEWLAEELGETAPAEPRRHIERIVDRVERMRTMIQGVLDFARAGRERAPVVRVDVGELVRAVVQLLDPPPGARIEIAPDLPDLETERIPLQQVFINLIGNALTHGARPGAPPEVRVQWSAEAGRHEFTVADSGPGIPPRMQGRIWTLFHSEARPGGPEGTGIGLAVVKKLVESRGGSIRVDSPEGGGTEFRFSWPEAAGGATISNVDGNEPS